jgi:hypothetical protein
MPAVALAMLAAALISGILAWGIPGRAPPPPQDRPLARPLPAADPLRLTVFGTSLTAARGWPEDLAAALGRCLGREVVLARVAGPGMGSAWGLGQVAAVAATAPDLVLMEFAINDADLRDGLSLAESRDTHRRLVAALRAALPEAAVVLMTMSPAQGLRGLMRPWLGQHYAAYRDLAAGADLGLVDLYPRWLALPRPARGLARDGLHPDPQVAAGVIVPAVLDYLGRAAGTDCPAPPSGGG